jgi:hypothetical protein
MDAGDLSVPEPKLEPNDKEQQPVPGEGPWNDKVLVDAVGCTKGLVAILDSLTDGFQHRGREIEEQRHRLAILQSERRAILEGRAEFEAEIAGLTAERDRLRGEMEARDRELERLRQETAQGQVALDARLEEIRDLQVRVAEPVRQTEELREIVRDLQRERESLTHRQAILEAELEEERRQARETAARATQAQTALREDLTDAENILAGLRKDLASAQGLTASLRRTAEEERSRSGLSQEQLRFQAVEVARLAAAIQGAQTLLGELDDALCVEGSEDAAHLGRESLAMLQPVVEGLRSVLGPADRAAIQLPRSSADHAAVRQRARQIADRWRQLMQDRVDSAQRERQLRDENDRLSAELAATNGAWDARREDPRSTPTRDRRPPAGEAVAPQGVGEKTLRRDDAGGQEVATPAAPPRAPKRRTALSGMTVECTLEASGGEAARILRGQIVSINTMGLMGAFEEPFPEDRRVAVRFIRGGEEFMFPGRIVRVQQSVATPDAPPVFNHLIRFESPVANPDA